MKEKIEKLKVYKEMYEDANMTSIKNTTTGIVLNNYALGHIRKLESEIAALELKKQPKTNYIKKLQDFNDKNVIDEIESDSMLGLDGEETWTP